MAIEKLCVIIKYQSLKNRFEDIRSQLSSQPYNLLLEIRVQSTPILK